MGHGARSHGLGYKTENKDLKKSKSGSNVTKAGSNVIVNNLSHRCHAILPWLFISLLSYGFSNLSTITINANETDRLALLSIKSQLHDPLGVTSSWNNSVPLCQWTGVSCGPRHQRVIGLNLRNQSIGGPLSPFIGNLSFLRSIQLQENKFYGEIPHEVGLLSRLENLRLSNNSFSGTIPTNLSHCSNLISFIANYNNLEGEIPAELGNLLKLQTLSISVNQLTGQLPASIGNISSLQFNQLTGTIPYVIGKLKNLQALDLSENSLQGSIPTSIGNLTGLTSLLLDSNNLKGNIPSNLGNCQNLILLSLSQNNLNGTLPQQILDVVTLSLGLNLSDNLLSGSFPSDVGKLKNLISLDISGNHFSREIPVTLGGCTSLEYLSLQGNSFSGSIPPLISWRSIKSNVTEISLVGNDNLCGGLAELHLPSCHSKGSEKSKITLLKVVIPMEEPFPMISYAELSKATNEFSLSNMIGEGSYGLVYKGLLAENGLLVAMKVINLQRKGASKSFIAECEALRNVRHRNLIKIMTICSSIDFKGNDFKALVYEYMQHGSLEEWLHRNKDQQKTTNLSLIQRLNIAIDVASAIEYLHHQWFMSSSIGIKGTIGYVAPEYGMGSEVSISGDVYSLGILLLEMFTGRRPTDNVFNDSLNLHDFVKTASPERATEIVEPSLLLDVRADNNEIENFARLRGEGRLRTEGCLVGVLRIGVLCSVEPSAERMEMTDVVVKLCAVRENFLGRWIVDVGPNARLSS
ncbi:hypothetical protein JRO89_XSUnG0165800 [Xanthoceras sorbifolium]|uniref:Protein kinase domain-containing protein n=1 Tax=Xanthoceras sorbifolium TaxID=99658 RepID=A0ABQ8GXQ2_9ROSI|nr:hypothetical protein JRO89_XSUnG0165800 [Xanthoceras sorbifolium]